MLCPSAIGTGALIAPYYQLVAVVAMALTLYVAIKYAAGRYMSNAAWVAAATVEASDLVMALVGGALAVGFFEFSRLITWMWTGGGTCTDPIETALHFLEKVLIRGLLEAINDVFTIQVFYSIMNTFSFRPHEAVWTWTFKIMPGADAIVSICNLLGYGLIALFGSVSAQMLILTLIGATMYKFVLPAGIILRFVPMTKDAGTFLIMFAIGFQVVFPMTYVLNMMALNDLNGGNYIPYVGSTSIGVWKYMFIGSAVPVGIVGKASGDILKELGAQISTKIPSLGLATAPLTLFGNFITMATMETTAYNLTFMMLRPILEALADLTVVSLFIPAFATMVTFAFINAMTKFANAKM
jgi:hypothetical protein